MNMIGGLDSLNRHCRKPQILADAAYAILSRDSRACTGNFFIGAFSSLCICATCMIVLFFLGSVCFLPGISMAILYYRQITVPAVFSLTELICNPNPKQNRRGRASQCGRHRL